MFTVTPLAYHIEKEHSLRIFVAFLKEQTEGQSLGVMSDTPTGFSTSVI